MRQLIRGRTLSFHADPVDTENAYTYHEDGASSPMTAGSKP